MLFRLALGLPIATVIVFIAWRSRLLTQSGAMASFACGLATVAASWNWAILLIIYFLAAAVLSLLSTARLDRVAQAVTEKQGARDAVQVLANGGLYSAAALVSAFSPDPVLIFVGLGALAASSSDTWATEIGIFAGKTPRLLLSRRKVPTGTSGGVTWPGSLGAILGAAFVGTVALAVGMPRAAAGVAIIAGVASAFADSLLGETIQVRRRDPVSHTPTERQFTSQGVETEITGGIRWITNDAVNALATCVGGAIALIASFKFI